MKARIEEFCELAGHEHIHKGMTSRDLTENVEQLQVFRALQVRPDARASPRSCRFAERARSNCATSPLTARTHNVAAQVTTVGKRIAMFGEEHARRPPTAWMHVARQLSGARLEGRGRARSLDQITLFDGDAGESARAG